MNVSSATINNWEIRQKEARTVHYPKIMEYLGYCPIPDDTKALTLGSLVRRHRMHRGLILRDAAIVIGVDPGALSNWEQGRKNPPPNIVEKLIGFIQYTGM